MVVALGGLGQRQFVGDQEARCGLVRRLPGIAVLNGGTVYRTLQGTLFGLRSVGSSGFDSSRTGLDHVSFAVEPWADLGKAAEGLPAAGVTHGEITDLTQAGQTILSFPDPDDIDVELSAPLSPTPREQAEAGRVPSGARSV